MLGFDLKKSAANILAFPGGFFLNEMFAFHEKVRYFNTSFHLAMETNAKQV